MCHRTRLFPGLVLFTALVFASELPVRGELVLFDDEASFVEAFEGMDLELDEFSDLDNGYYANSIGRWIDEPTEYSLASTSIVGLSIEFSQVRTVLPKSMISFQSDSTTVRAIGATFGITDFSGNPIKGQIRILLQDGRSYTWDVADGSSFVGVIGVDESVTSLIVGAATNAPLVIAEGVLIGAVPSPAAWPLVLLSMVGVSRRRRS